MKKSKIGSLSLMCIATVFCAGIFAFPRIAKADTFSCSPTDVIELSNRIHVRCSNSITLGSDTVKYLSINLSDESKCARFISMANTALLSGNSFYVGVSPTSETNVSGCAANDCRTPYFFGVKK